jgi:hypothetical protein
MEIASENDFFSKPENVKLWVEEGKVNLKWVYQLFKLITVRYDKSMDEGEN